MLVEDPTQTDVLAGVIVKLGKELTVIVWMKLLRHPFVPVPVTE